MSNGKTDKLIGVPDAIKTNHVGSGNKKMKNIRFEQAIVISEQVDKQKLIDLEEATVKQQEAIEDFLSSKCDLYSSADWHYFAEVTGKPISWLRENASYSDLQGSYGQMLANAIIDHDDELVEMFFM